MPCGSLPPVPVNAVKAIFAVIIGVLRRPLRFYDGSASAESAGQALTSTSTVGRLAELGFPAQNSRQVSTVC